MSAALMDDALKFARPSRFSSIGLVVKTFEEMGLTLHSFQFVVSDLIKHMCQETKSPQRIGRLCFLVSRNRGLDVDWPLALRRARHRKD